MKKIVFITSTLLFFCAFNLAAQQLSQAEKITPQYKVDLQALEEHEKEQLQQGQEKANTAILPFSKEITLEEEMKYWTNQKAKIQTYIQELQSENHNNQLTPMIKKYEKALEQCELKIANLSIINKE